MALAYAIEQQRCLALSVLPQLGGANSVIGASLGNILGVLKTEESFSVVR